MTKKSGRRKPSAKRAPFAKKIFARLTAALVTAVTGWALWAGRQYGLFGGLLPNIGAEEGFTDVNGTSAFAEFIDVGQGDCTLIGSEGHYMLIDTGDRDADDTVIKRLNAEGIVSLDYLILTHPHADHIGEAADIIEQFYVGEVIMPEVPEELVPTSSVYEGLLDAAEARGIGFHKAADEHFTLGGCVFDTFAPRGEYDDLNDYSVIVRVTHGKNRFLITGDCEQAEEKEFLMRGAPLSADVLKAGHHGSSSSSGAEFLAAVSPTYTVISCGRDNDYGHPHEEALTRIRKFSPRVYITAEVGSVRFDSDGEELRVIRNYEFGMRN